LSGNRTTGNFSGGGGIFALYGTVTLTSSNLSSNSTTGEFANGGGISAFTGAVTLTRSTLSGNRTAGRGASGGGIASNSAAVTLNSSTLSGNRTAGEGAYGGGISARFGNVTLTSSTLSGNRTTGFAAQGGGIFANVGKLTLANSIVALNTAGSGFSTNPDLVSNGTGPNAPDIQFSLIGDNSGTLLTGAPVSSPDVNGNLIGTAAAKIDPKLGPLQNNGGPTFTRALLINSPAFNRGSNALAVDVTQPGNPPLTTDQRGSGFGRVQFGIVDMGALESSLLDSPEGTIGADAFVLTYSSTTTSGTVIVTVSSSGGPVINLGTFPMNSPLRINGLGGTDSVRIVGTSGADTFTVTGTTLTINGASLILTNIENRTLAGAAGNDTYKFDADAALGLWTLDEALRGIDTIDFSLTTTVGLSLNLGSAATQVAHPTNLRLNLKSVSTFENIVGGAGGDTFTGNALANVLNGNAGGDTLNGAGGNDSLNGGTGDDTLNGGAGNDALVGGLGDDIYIFGQATTAEADTATEGANGGVDTLNFSAITTSVTLSLATGAVQPVHTNRTLRLNSTIQFENAAGGSASDTLNGNTVANVLIGNAGNDALNGLGGRDMLIGGLGLDTINGGDEEDILIAGRTANDALFSNLNVLRTGWLAVTPYATRIAALRAGTGSPAVSLKAKVNVLNDAGEDDQLNGGTGTDWYFRAVDDVITGLAAGEILDVL